MKNFLYLFLFFIQSFKNLYSQTLTFPFSRYYPLKFNETNFFLNYENNIIYTSLKIGTPPVEIIAQIKMTQYSLCIRNDSIFNYKSSSTYRVNGKEFSMYNLDFYLALPSNESFIIGKEKKKINDVKFMLTKTSYYDLDGIIGLFIHQNDYRVFGHGFISQLKSKNLINQEVFFFNYDENKEDGELIIGDYPHSLEKFKNIYPEEQREDIGIHIPSLDIDYEIFFRSTFWNGKEIESLIVGKIYIETGIIIGTELFKKAVNESFFESHYKNKKCVEKGEKLLNSDYITIVCDDYDELDISKFPVINFYNSDTNYNLTLTYEDIFIKKNGKIYFMIIFKKKPTRKEWILGDIFLKRNMIAFNMDKRTMTIYDKNKVKKKDVIINDKSILTYIIIISVAGAIIIFLIGFIVYKFVIKPRTKKAYELKEDYEYINQEQNQIND